MKRLQRHIIALVAFMLTLTVAFTGCSNGQPVNQPVYTPVNMEEIMSNKESDKLLRFSSSDEEFDEFINDFMHRHLRYDDERVGSATVGDVTSVMFEREWDSLALCWFDSTRNALSTNNLENLKNWFTRVGIDKFGYVWSSDRVDVGDTTAGPVFFRQGWPFPTYAESLGAAPGFEFNDTDAEGNPVEDKTGGFTCSETSATVSGGLYTVRVNSANDLVYEKTGLNVNTIHSPFLELAIAVNKIASADSANADDLYIYWKRSGDADYSDERMVRQGEFGTLTEKIGDVLDRGETFSNTVFLPMYLHPLWGTDSNITAVKIVIKPKSGQEMHIRSRINYLRFNYDTRQSANAAQLLTAARNYYEFTRDYSHLRQNINRYRSALQFMLTHLKGADGLLDLSYFVGHDGLVLDEGYTRMPGHGIGDNYWDILALPQINLSSNIYFYKAVRAMRDLESIAEEQNINAEKPSVKGAQDWKTDVKYTQDSSSLTELLSLIKKRINEYFWNSKTGRLHLGYNLNNTAPIDYGYVVFNLEAVCEDILDGDRAKSVMDWISGKRTVKGDDSTGSDIYKFEFAPRTSTARNAMQYVWPWVAVDKPFGRQVQDGGSVLWASYYDITARMKVYGADNAWQRFKEIQAWYKKVKAAGGTGRRFYRDYYEELWFEDRDYSLQGGGQDGGLGLDEEFIENAILYAAVPFVFMGLNAGAQNALTVSPELPGLLGYIKTENLMYSGVVYDMAVSPVQIAVSNVRGETENVYVKLKFKLGKEYKIYVDGKEADSVREGDYITATVPFGEFIAEAKK